MDTMVCGSFCRLGVNWWWSPGMVGRKSFQGNTKRSVCLNVSHTLLKPQPRYFDIRYRYLEQPEEKTYNTDLNLYGEANAILALTVGVMAWRL